jgi:hypothetical protein
MAQTVDNGSLTDFDVAIEGEAGGKVHVVGLSPTTIAALESITATVANWPTTQPVSGTVALDSGSLGALETIELGASTLAALENVTVTVSNPSSSPSASLWVTAVGTAGQSVTLTLPAPGASNFHHINRLEIAAFSSAARTGNATPVTVTTTNLPGTPAFTFQSAGAVGTIERQVIEPAMPIRSNTANTATTVVCPATTNVIWRLNASYAAMA